jgi:P4 family phage/plasmid primase-like protien
LDKICISLENAHISVPSRNGPQIHSLTEKAYNPKAVAERLETVIRVPEERVAPFRLSGEMTGSEYMVTFRDRLINVQTGREERVGPGWFDPVSLNAQYDTDATCPLWLNSLQEWSGGGEEWVSLLQLLFGYAILPIRDYQKWFLLYGVPRSGKGTVLHTMRALIGSNAVLTKGLTDLVGPFGLDGLESARVLVVNEVHQLDRGEGSKASAIVKQLVGQDPLNINIKYVRPLRNVESRALPILQSNEIPTLEDRAGGLSSKMVLVPFSVSFLDRENTQLVHQLRGEMDGIAQWALEGARRVVTAPVVGVPRFPMLRVAQDAVDDYLLAVNPFNRFLETYFTQEAQAWVSFDMVWSKWRQWARTETTSPGVTMYTLTRKLLEGSNWRLTRNRRRRGTVRGFLGMRLRYTPMEAGEGGD